tara:strand:- start:60 stop:263 length:204 start_codon:yes stop_codon:yes gene_type:complete
MGIIIWTIGLFVIYYISYKIGTYLEPTLKGFTFIAVLILAIFLLVLYSGFLNSVGLLELDEFYDPHL